jgi:acyl homoserine lactone synthase
VLHAINIENAHEFGSVLPQLHRLRYRQFKERQSYDVPVYNGMEYDQYDTLATVYLVWLDEGNAVRGCSRLNPTDRPYMLRELWPQLADRPLPSSPFVWEGTRICIEKELPGDLRQRIKWEIVLGYLEFGLANGIMKYIGVMQTYIWRKVFIASGWGAEFIGGEGRIDGARSRVGEVLVSAEALDRVRRTTGIVTPVLRNPFMPAIQPAALVA